MKKRITVMFFAFTLCFTSLMPVFNISQDAEYTKNNYTITVGDASFAEVSVAKGTLDRMIDEASLLSDKERSDLTKKLYEISKRQGCDIVILTVKSMEGKQPIEFAKDFYQNEKSNMGLSENCMVFMLSTEERDWAIFRNGNAKTAFTVDGQKFMFDNIKSELKKNKYYEAFDKFADLGDDFLTQANTGKPYEGKNMPKGSVSPIWILGDLIIGAIVAFFVLNAVKSPLKSVKFERDAESYVRTDSLNITNRNDLFLYTTVSRVEIPKSNDSGSFSSDSDGNSSGKY